MIWMRSFQNNNWLSGSRRIFEHFKVPYTLYIHGHTHTCTHMYTHAHTRTYMYMHMHMHMYTQTTNMHAKGYSARCSRKKTPSIRPLGPAHSWRGPKIIQACIIGPVTELRLWVVVYLAAGMSNSGFRQKRERGKEREKEHFLWWRASWPT
jgi:hypothetical protein